MRAARSSTPYSSATRGRHDPAPPRPGQHDGAGARNDHEPALRTEGRVQGNAGVVHDLDGDRPGVVPKCSAEPVGEGLLLVGAAGPGHARTDRQVIDEPLGPKGFLYQGGQHLDRLVHPDPLRVGGGSMTVDPSRTLLALGEQQRRGATGVKADEEGIGRHGERASVESEMRGACGRSAHSHRLVNGSVTTGVSIGTGA